MPDRPETNDPAASAGKDAKPSGSESSSGSQGPKARTNGIMEPVRRHFRVQTPPEAAPLVEINGVQFRVFDVSEGGICHLLSKQETFQVGDMPEIKVTIAGQEIELSGVVVHVTPHGDDRVRCGIMFSAMGPDALDIIRRYVDETRARLFGE